MVSQFSEASHKAWGRFVRFFESDIRSRMVQQLPRNAGRAEREDAYQEICLKLIENDFHRVRAYGGRGSFTGYVLTVVDRILVDLVRRAAPRRRLPAAVARSTPLDRALYAAVVWDGCPQDIGRLVAALRGRLERDPGAAEVAESLARVVRIVRLGPARAQATDAVSLDMLVNDGWGLSLADPAPTPEDCILLAEEERNGAALVAAVKAAVADLPADGQLYLQTIFSASEPLPARKIARLIGCPVEEVYRLRKRTQRWLKDMAVQLQKNRDICPFV
jgi:RNA polymerase primary sigma factor